jgi:hypothetical protein
MSGSGSTDGSSAGNSLAPDTTTQSPDNTPTTRSTVPDQSVSGVQPEQGGGSAVVVPDKGTSGSGSTNDKSGSSGPSKICSTNQSFIIFSSKVIVL